VTSIILGTVLGGILINARVSGLLLNLDMPYIETGIDTPAEAAIALIVFIYALAAFFNLYVPNTGVPLKKLPPNPIDTLTDFYSCFRRLWADKLGQISLAVTTLFWGAGATLQFIVIEWARHNLGFDLSRASILQGVVAFGIALGAVIASSRVKLHQSVRVIPLGIAMGLIVPFMVMVHSIWVAIPLMILIGGLAGFFVVPMNALLQHRGHNLMGAGRSIAVQNFNENSSILLMIACYSLMLASGVSITWIIILFGLFVAGTMAIVQRWFTLNKLRHATEINRLLEIAKSEKH